MTHARLKQLLQSATPLPWHWDSDPVKGDPTGRVRYHVCALGKTVTKVYYSSFEGGPTCAEADAALIAEGITALPEILAENERLKAALEELSESALVLVRLQNKLDSSEKKETWVSMGELKASKQRIHAARNAAALAIKEAK